MRWDGVQVMSQNTSRITPGLVQGGLVQRKNKATASEDAGTFCLATSCFFSVGFVHTHEWMSACVCMRVRRPQQETQVGRWYLLFIFGVFGV